MGLSLLNHPKEVFKGCKTGIIDLKIEKENLLQLTLPEFKTILKKEKSQRINWFSFVFWCFISAVIFLFPLLILILLLVINI